MRPGVTIYFVRHGETDWNAARRYQGQRDIALNDKGRAQVRGNGASLARHLRDLDGLAFVSSPLGRTRETMEILRTTLGLAPDGYAIDERLRELSYGHWEGLLASEVPLVDPEGYAARERDPFHWRPRGGESYADLMVRTDAWLADVDRDLVVAGHGGVSRTLRARILGLDVSQTLALDVPQDRILVLRRESATWL